MLFSAGSEHSPVFAPGNRAEQDPKTWRAALFNTLKKVGEFLVCNPEAKPDCIAITSQRASVIPVDEAGNPLHNALMWQDKRARAECGWIESKISGEDLYHACGLRLDPCFSLPKMLWLRSNEPKTWSKTQKLIGVQDYISFLLTGEMTTDWSQACRTMLMDLSNFTRNEKLLNLSGIGKSILCKLIPPRAVRPARSRRAPQGKRGCRKAWATIMGCLISACVSQGVYGDYESAFRAVMTSEEEEFLPDGDRGRIYSKNRAVKRAIYAALNGAGIYEMST